MTNNYVAEEEKDGEIIGGNIESQKERNQQDGEGGRSKKSFKEKRRTKVRRPSQRWIRRKRI
eukprot:13632570-Ditylum_brightwellii.AAC.1